MTRVFIFFILILLFLFIVIVALFLYDRRPSLLGLASFRSIGALRPLGLASLRTIVQISQVLLRIL
jgi:hypothetical protein